MASTNRAAAAPAEVDRILLNPHNGYAVLGVPRDADAAAVKAAYRRLSLLVHPDRCAHPRATDAAAAVNRAADALSETGWKRRMYDAFVDDVERGGGGTTAAASFEEWQAAAIRLPRWAARVLACPGGPCLLCVGAVISLPLLLVAAFLLFVVCFPIQTLLSLCGVVPPPWKNGATAAADTATATTVEAPPAGEEAV